MMRRHHLVSAHALTLVTALSIAAAGATTASAQTLFATRGLGAPISPVDARGSALGGVVTGLGGINTSLANPADISGLLRRGGSATLSPSWNQVELDGASERIGGSRFPLLRVFYPVNVRLAASLSYGGYLDQTWGVTFTGKEVLGTDTVATSDVVSSTGGISQLRLALSYALTDKLAFGVGGGLLTGNLDRAVNRTFTDSVFDPFESRLRWSFKAPQATVGLRFDPFAGTRIAASMAIAGKLKANSEDSVAQDREYGSSMRFNAGASTVVLPALLVVAGVTRDKYPEITAAAETSADGLTAGASTRDTWQYGGGVEYTGLHSGMRTFPFRAGLRYQQLPYAGATEVAPKEVAVTFGTGYDLVNENGIPQALLDISLERAKRTGLDGPLAPGGLTEKFWRMNVTFSLFSR
jgi:hypothetical protein